MPYLPNIPIGPQSLSSSQPQIRDNFNISNSVYGVDHYDYTVTGTNLGHHKNVTMPVVVTPPTPSASQFTIYSKTVSGSSELFAKRDGSPTEFQLTSGGNININAAAGYIPILASASMTYTGSFDGVVNYGFNVASTTWDGLTFGQNKYRVNFTTPLPSANYTVFLSTWSTDMTTVQAVVLGIPLSVNYATIVAPVLAGNNTVYFTAIGT